MNVSRLFSILFLAGFCLLAASHSAAQQPETLAEQSRTYADGQTPELEALIAKIDAKFSDPTFDHAFWGVVIESLDTGRVWYERNAEKLFMPASNQKIPTTAVALLVLGPDFTFPTIVATNGEVKEGTLEGDLVVFGYGDPTLYERWLDDSRDVFREWARTLKEKYGIERISGNVVGDDDSWEDDNYDSSWPISNMVWWYGAEFGPLQLNEDYIDFRVYPPDSPDGEARIVPNLPSSYFTVENRVEVVESGSNYIDFTREPFFSNNFIATGRVVVGRGSTEESPAIHNPTQFYVHVLNEVLEEEGIDVAGEPLDCDRIEGWDADPDQMKKLIERQSPPLSEIAAMLMKRSQNLYAETMVRAVAWKERGKGTFRGGHEIIQDKLKELGVEGDFSYSDGSGLSRYNYIAPRQIATILKAMRETDVWGVWYDAFPIAGVDGTIRNRMKGTPAEGNVRAKTGTISNVRGLSGYVTTADGENLVFSFLVNAHMRSGSANEAITDGVLEMIAAFDREENIGGQ